MIGRLICVVGLVAAVACSAPSPGPLSGLFSPSKRGPVDDLLDRRSQAFRHGDERAYLADLDRGQPALVDRERMMFANLRQLTSAPCGWLAAMPTRRPRSRTASRQGSASG